MHHSASSGKLTRLVPTRKSPAKACLHKYYNEPRTGLLLCRWSYIRAQILGSIDEQQDNKS